MVPLSLLIWIALEIAGYLAIGRLWLDIDWSAAVVGAIGGLLGLRAGIVAVTWIFGTAYASPAPRQNLATKARMMFGEYLAFERLWMPADRLPTGRRPILLVHGYGCSRGVWWRLRRRLEAAGHTVATLSLVPPYTSIGKLVPQLNQRIEAVCATTGSKQVTLLGHSMGGLVCRSYLARHGSARVERLITLATPHAGSALARLGIGQNAREMEPDSLWLRDMAGERLPIPTVSLRNPYDNFAMPQDNQRLPGAKDVELPPVGHLAMLYDGKIADIVLKAYRDERKNMP